MPRNLYVNLPVKDLQRSIEFFAALGFSFNPTFTDQNATCMIVNDNASVMLLVEPFFSTFTTKAICNTREAAEALLALSMDSRAEVDDFVARAVAAGGTEDGEAKDHGFMYERGVLDPDGHNWGVFHMDESQFPPKQ